MGRIVWFLSAIVCLFNTAWADHSPPILQWTTEPGVTHRIYMAESPDGPTEMVEMGSSTEAYLPELKPGEIRFFRATSVRDGHESEFSNQCAWVIPHISIKPGGEGVLFWFYRVPVLTGNLKYTLELTEDLKEWKSEIPFEPKISRRDDGAEVYSVFIPHEYAGKLFGRIKLEMAN